MSERTIDLRARRASALRGETTVPGDKSIGHRAVIFGALCDGPVRVRGLSGGEDNRRTVAALAALGVTIEEPRPGELRIAGVGLDGLRAPAHELDCGNSGTSIRLLAGLLAPRPFRSRLTGDRYLHARPMRRVADPLRAMGARIGGAPGKKPDEIYPPLDVGGTTERVRSIVWPSPIASAQVKSAVLLAALDADRVTFVEPALSRDHTERMLAHLGAPVFARRRFLTPTGGDLGLSCGFHDWPRPRRLHARDLDVPGDLSSAAFLLAAATLVPGSRVVVRGVGTNPTRTGFLDALAKMGGRVSVEHAREQGGEPVADLVAEPAALRGTEIAGELAVRAIDELPLLATLAAHAEGETVIRDAAELRVKESDRVAATCAMLRAFGVDCDERPDGLVVRGGARLRGGEIDSRGDHRIAMCGAICALAADGDTLIHDAANIATSFPTFVPSLRALGAELDES